MLFTFVQITQVGVSGSIKFTSNFLGTFSLSELIILPETIDFTSLFLNFSEKLADSPYVLALNCVMLALTVVVTIILRHVDIKDSNQVRNVLSLYYFLANTRQLQVRFRTGRADAISSCFVCHETQRFHNDDCDVPGEI